MPQKCTRKVVSQFETRNDIVKWLGRSPPTRSVVIVQASSCCVTLRPPVTCTSESLSSSGLPDLPHSTPSGPRHPATPPKSASLWAQTVIRGHVACGGSSSSCSHWLQLVPSVIVIYQRDTERMAQLG
ncbi:hypothetical protein BGW80DRAFT_569336 [Lactifluus volemus]|nr:hypothetical protein BGW80DRAFT_569336 [Lactifluus volemus]